LSESELVFLQKSDASVAWGSLLIFRLASHRRLQEISSLESSPPTRSSNLPWSSLFTTSSRIPNSTSSQTDSDSEDCLRRLSRDIRHSLHEQAVTNPYPVNLTIIFSRFALSLDSDDLQTRLVTIISYGLLWGYNRNCLSCAGLCTVRLGAIRVFGNNGFQLLSCGDHTDEWFHNFDIQSTDQEIALSFQYQWTVHTQRPTLRNVSFPSETVHKATLSPSKSLSPLPGIRQHHIVEIICANIFVTQDPLSLQSLWKIYSRLIESRREALSDFPSPILSRLS
jgi:hypothetical protein